MNVVKKKAKKETSEECWRRLAMQFDNHRMLYKWHLEALLNNPDHREKALAFLATGPKDGNQIMAERIMAERIKTLALNNKEK